MAHEYTLVDNLATVLTAIEPQSIVSRTLIKEEGFKALLFGFDAGQELSEHTSSQAAVLQIVQGDATVTAGDDCHELSAGSLLYMAPRLKHSVYAKTPLLLLLQMYAAE
jgi:quercetin dioxygenase-like cupin family protein